MIQDELKTFFNSISNIPESIRTRKSANNEFSAQSASFHIKCTNFSFPLLLWYYPMQWHYHYYSFYSMRRNLSSTTTLLGLPGLITKANSGYFFLIFIISELFSNCFKVFIASSYDRLPISGTTILSASFLACCTLSMLFLHMLCEFICIYSLLAFQAKNSSCLSVPNSGYRNIMVHYLSLAKM